MWNIHGVEQMLTCTKSVLEHTCMHGKDSEGLHHPQDMPRIKEEIKEVIKYLKRIQRSLCKEVFCEDNVKMWNYLHDMLKILRPLYKEIYTFEPSDGPTHLDHYRHIISKTRDDVHHIYGHMLHHVKHMGNGSITKEMEEFYTLSELTV